MYTIAIVIGILGAIAGLVIVLTKKKKQTPVSVVVTPEKEVPVIVPAVPKEKLKYVSFEKDEYELYLNEGEDVVVLTKEKLDFTTSSFITDYLDSAWKFYKSRAYGHPSYSNVYNGKVIIAQVASTCGAGCGYLGGMGIEIQDDYMEKAIQSAKDLQVDRIFLYEMGRNWWLYNQTLAPTSAEYTGAVITGFAVYMAFCAADHLRENGYAITTFNGIEFSEFQNDIRNLVSEYIDKDLTYSSTLALGKGVPSAKFSGGADLFAAIMMHVDDKFCNGKLSNSVWVKAGKAPTTKLESSAIHNLINAVSQVAGKNLDKYFIDVLNFDILE